MKLTELVQTVEQVADRLALSPQTIRDRCITGNIPCVKVGIRWRIPDQSGIARRLWEELPDELTAIKVQQILRIQKLTFNQLITSGALPARHNGKNWVVSKVKLMEFLGLNLASQIVDKEAI